MNSKTKSISKVIQKEYREHRVRFLLRALVLVAAIAFLLFKRSIWTPDTLLVILVVIGFVFGRGKEFIIRFAPFLGLLIIYDSFRSIADDLNNHVNYWPMIYFDTALGGGTLPTQILQSAWWHGSVSWYDFYFYFLYTIHFLVPVVIALILWKYRPKLYWPFVWSFVGISFLAFITFVLFPAAPPWLAHQLGYFGGDFTRISSEIWRAMGIENFSEVYSKLSPNEVAAVPSLHSAYPLLASLFVIAAFGIKRVWWILIYPISMWIGVVYLGEHYVFDIIIAILYVALVYVVVNILFKRYRARKKLPRKK